MKNLNLCRTQKKNKQMPQRTAITQMCFVVQLILFLFLYIKESIMETKHKKAGTSEEEKNKLNQKSNNS